MTQTFPIQAIKVAGRARHEMGDIEALAASIRKVGLLQPVLIRSNGTLIAGARRLAAYRLLKRTQVEVYVRDDLKSVLELLYAERDENTCRQALTPSEAVDLGRRLEELERPSAAQSQGSHLRVADRDAQGRAKPSSGESPELGSQGKNRANEVTPRVASAVGMGETKYKHAKKVVEAAETGDPDAIAAVTEMDRTGNVEPQYTRLKDEGVIAPGRVQGGSRVRANPAQKIVEELTHQCRLITRRQPDIDAGAIAQLDLYERQQWLQELKDGRRVLSSVITALSRAG